MDVPRPKATLTFASFALIAVIGFTATPVLIAQPVSTVPRSAVDGAKLPGQANAKMPTPEQVIQKCEDAYAALHSYSGISTVHLIGFPSVAKPFIAKIQFERPGRIFVSAVDDNRPSVLVSYVSNGSASYANVDGSWERQPSAEMAVAVATGISMSAATTIPVLLLHLEWGYPFYSHEPCEFMTTAAVNEHSCFKITVGIPGDTVDIYWIDKKTFLLRRRYSDGIKTIEDFTNIVVNPVIAPTVFILPLKSAEAITNAEKSAKAWLRLVDSGHYGASWQAAAPAFQAAVSKAMWVQSITSARKPLGLEQKRVLMDSRCTSSFPGAPPGQYVIIQYAATFSKAGAKVETVTPMLDKDGKWRVSGYYVK